MKAIVLEGVQQPLRIQETAIPTLKEGEALVRIRAAAFNRRDWWIQQGKYAGLQFPLTPGSDGVGIVEEINGSVAARQQWLGKSVIINPSLYWQADSAAQPPTFKILGLPDPGTFAEYVKVPLENLFLQPTHLSDVEAAALPLAGLTSYRALFTKGKLQKGEKVLVTGVGGGVATFVLLWATHAGAEVYVTSGQTSKIEAAKKLGAAGGSNYRSEGWQDLLKAEAGGFDVIIDSALGDQFRHFPDLANPGGRIVFFGGTAGNIPELDGRKIFWKQLTLAGTTMGSAGDFANMLAFATKHQAKPIIDSVHALDEAEQAIRRLDDSAQFGKIVLEVR